MPSTRGHLCYSCHKEPAASNGYCKRCNAKRAASKRRTEVGVGGGVSELPGGIDEALVASPVERYVASLSDAQVYALLEHLLELPGAAQVLHK